MGFGVEGFLWCLWNSKYPAIQTNTLYRCCDGTGWAQLIIPRPSMSTERLVNPRVMRGFLFLWEEVTIEFGEKWFSNKSWRPQRQYLISCRCWGRSRRLCRSMILRSRPMSNAVCVCRNRHSKTLRLNKNCYINNNILCINVSQRTSVMKQQELRWATVSSRSLWREQM